MNFGGYDVDVHGPLYISCLFFQKIGKSTGARPILKLNSTSFRVNNCFPMMNNEKFKKWGPREPHCYFFMK